jgi:hypothetical protein
MMRTSYSEWAVTQGFVFITDAGHRGKQSVTNDAERVVQECLGRYGERRIIYRDKDGQWGEMLHTGIQFRGFAPFDGDIPGQERAA